MLGFNNGRNDDSSSSGSSSDASSTCDGNGNGKPHLDPQAVIALAASIPNCGQVWPPNRCTVPPTDGASAAGNADNNETSYFSQFSRHLQHTFSGEDMNSSSREQQLSSINRQVLSFLVSDSYSIEKLAAEAEAGRRISTSELEGAGIARIDVYCNSGTVVTCRVIQTGDAPNGGYDPAPGVADDGLALMHALATPRKGNRGATTNAASGDGDGIGIGEGGAQIRRIIRRKCNIQGLRRILEQPPKLPEIAYIADAEEEGGAATDYDSDVTEASTVSSALRRRQMMRQQGGGSSKGGVFGKKKKAKSLMSKEQQSFLQKQRLKYEKRLRRDERAREHVGNAILAGGMSGVEYLSSAMSKSLSLDDTIGSSHSTVTSATAGTIATSEENPALAAQRAIQEKIEVADMGLAILMGEAQRLEKMMQALKEEEEEKAGGGKDKKGGGDNASASLKSKQGMTRTRSGGSFSTLRSTDHEDDDGSECSSAYREMDERDLAMIARIMQGCEVEYSFPQEHHDELEGALMGDDDDSSTSSSSSSSDEDSEEVSRASSSLKRSRGRGRSPSRRGKGGGKASGANKLRMAAENLSPIVAIPTNGEGCVVLRKNGAFDVVGQVPKVLHEKLFRTDGPLPDQISLGTE